jgi:hypothetical protein
LGECCSCKRENNLAAFGRVCYLPYPAKYKIDEGFYAKIISDLKERGQLM